VSFENLCMVYNGYAQTPEYFCGPGCCRAVVPQSFSFNPDAMLAWDVKHGNAANPWTLPHGKAAATIVAQLMQSGITALCDPAFHRSAFFKFCVNNAANLLAVIEEKNCRELVRPHSRCICA
jgi:ketopantoate reductase